MRLYSIIIAGIIGIAMVCTATAGSADDAPRDPLQPFYKANTFYQAGDYAKAAEEYLKVLDAGFESGNLYYNIGNSFLKMGKLGYAILCYEKARRFIPADGDLKANMEYAKAMREEYNFQIPPKSPVVAALEAPFKALTLNMLTLLAIALYVLVALIIILYVAYPMVARRTMLVGAAIMVLFVFVFTGFSLRYYREEIRHRGVVMVKETEAKYEPIEKATTYYKVYEGQEVTVCATRSDWRQIRRRDGKLAWVPKTAVEEI